MASWAWRRPAYGDPPLSPGGFADYIGVSRREVTRWLQAPVTDPLPLFTLPVARQVARATGLPLEQLLIASAITTAEDPLFHTRGAWAYVSAEVEQRGPREPERPRVRRAGGEPTDQSTEALGSRLAYGQDAGQDGGAGHAVASRVHVAAAESDVVSDAESDVVSDHDQAVPRIADSITAHWAANLAAGAVSLRDLCVWYLRAMAPPDGPAGSERVS